jgi:hypothetical protein
MLRPPALQLKLDNRFPHPVRSPKPSKSTSSFVSQLYKANWKNPIIAVAGLNTLRFVFAAFNALQDAAVDDLEEADNLFLVSLALGAMYIFASVIEIYGVVSISMQRLNLIRLYLYFSLLACVLVIGAGVLNGISYFAFAEELVLECVELATDGHGYRKSLFRGQLWPISGFHLTAHDARNQCVYAWVYQSWYQVTSVFLFSVFPAVINFVMVYAYYLQTINRNHSACLINTYGDDRSNHRTAPLGRMETYSQVGYTRVAGRDNEISQRNVNTNVSGRANSRLEYAHNLLSPRRRTPQVSKSQRGVGASKGDAPMNKKPLFVSRSLKRDHRPPPLIQSPSPVGLSPGPPSYGPSKVYAAFAAPVLS